MRCRGGLSHGRGGGGLAGGGGSAVSVGLLRHRIWPHRASLRLPTIVTTRNHCCTTACVMQSCASIGRWMGNRLADRLRHHSRPKSLGTYLHAVSKCLHPSV